MKLSDEDVQRIAEAVGRKIAPRPYIVPVTPNPFDYYRYPPQWWQPGGSPTCSTTTAVVPDPDAVMWNEPSA